MCPQVLLAFREVYGTTVSIPVDILLQNTLDHGIPGFQPICDGTNISKCLFSFNAGISAATSPIILGYLRKSYHVDGWYFEDRLHFYCTSRMLGNFLISLIEL
jgi:hypothetical protein